MTRFLEGVIIITQEVLMSKPTKGQVAIGMILVPIFMIGEGVSKIKQAFKKLTKKS